MKLNAFSTFLSNFGVLMPHSTKFYVDVCTFMFSYQIYLFSTCHGGAYLLLLSHVNSMKKTMTESMWRLLSYVSACFALSQQTIGSLITCIAMNSMSASTMCCADANRITLKTKVLKIVCHRRKLNSIHTSQLFLFWFGFVSTAAKHM